jgi:hypothetical protein
MVKLPPAAAHAVALRHDAANTVHFVLRNVEKTGVQDNLQVGIARLQVVGKNTAVHHGHFVIEDGHIYLASGRLR